jgi:hypothetical protein
MRALLNIAVGALTAAVGILFVYFCWLFIIEVILGMVVMFCLWFLGQGVLSLFNTGHL